MWCFSSYLPTINLVLFVFLFPSRMIENSSLSPTREVFMRVAYEIFSDGKFNWGRVVALFYFACRLVIKVRLFFQKRLKLNKPMVASLPDINTSSQNTQALVTQVPDIIRTIINWTVDYLRENVINWIMEQGGWVRSLIN